MAKNLMENIVPKCAGDVPILLIDHDTTSIAFLTSVLEQFSCKVMSVNEASKAPSVIEEQKDIRLVIANIELPHIDSHSFLTALLEKDIPLILICPEIKTEKISQFLTKRACFCLKKPFSEKDIKNMWQHVSHKKSQKLEKNNVAGKQENVVDEDMETLKRPTTGQLSLLGKRPIKEKIKNSETYQKRRCLANPEWKTKLECPAKIENKKEEWKKGDNNVGRHRSLWTYERHMNFLAAISILGEKNPRPESILKIMNDPNLTKRQVCIYLQKYKAQVERINDTLPRKEWRLKNKTFEYPSNYEYPFKPSNLKENLIKCNSLCYPLRENNSPSSSNSQSSVKKPVKKRNRKMPKIYLSGKLDLDNHPFFGNMLDESDMEVNGLPPATSNNPPYNISPTNDDNHSGLVSASLSSNNLPILSGLPSSVYASNTNAFQVDSIPQSNPNPFQSPSSTLETNRNQIGLDPTSTQNAYVLPDYTMNHFEANVNQMDWFSSTESYVPSQNMVSSTTQEGFLHYETSSAVQYSVIPSETNMPLPQTNINHMGMASSGESYVLPQDIVNFYETNITHMSLVTREISYRISSETNTTILETNINLTDWVCFEERYVLLGNMISSTANTTQVDLVPPETTSAMDSVIPPETNMVDTSLVHYDDGYDVPIEDLVSFDTNIDEMNMQSCLRSYESAFNTPIGSTSHTNTEGQDHSFAMHLGSTSQQDTIMENQREGLDGGNNLDDDRDMIDWINRILSEDA